MINLKNIILIFSIILLIKLSYGQNLNQEEKETIINNLDSTDHSIRLNAILDIYQFNIVEALQKLENQIFLQEQDIAFWYLKSLGKFNSTQIVNIAHRFIDTIGSLPRYEKYNDEGISINQYKIEATFWLFKNGDYSTASIVFDYINEFTPNVETTSFLLLDDIVENVPEYEMQAKQELLRIMKIPNEDHYSPSTVRILAEKYGVEIIPDLIYVFDNSMNYTTRLNALKYLDRLDYPELDNFLIMRFLTDSTVADLVLEKIVQKYFTPSNYVYVSFNLNSALKQSDYAYYSIAFNYFEPSPPKYYSTLLEYLDYTSLLCDTLLLYTWLGDLQFKDELQSILQSAKTNLQNGDSLACREDVKTFQDSVDYVYADSLNLDPRFVTLEGWKFLYWNAQYILDRLPEIPSTEEISSYSIFATHGVWLEQNSEVLSGNIGVNEIGEPPFMDSGVELSIGISTETPASYSIKANRIKVKQNATVNADIYYNELDNNGTVTGTLSTPLELPLFTTLPEFHTSVPGTENIVVPQNGEYTLLPGAYNEIQVKKNGKLIFTGGEYHIFKFNGGDNNQILFQSESEVRIKDKFDSGQGSYIGPEDTTTVSADEIVFYVEGINGNNGNLGATPKAAKIGISNAVKANFYVPNGTLWLRQNSEAEGAFIGKDVNVGIGVEVRLRSAF